MKNPNAKVLTYRYNWHVSWVCIGIDQIEEYLKLYPKEEMPKTKIGRVRLFIKDAEQDGLHVRLSRYFDTADYQKEQRQFNQMEQEARC